MEERIGSNLKWGFNPRPHSNLTNDNPFSSCLARITGTTVALHCGKAHVQSQRKGANFDPHDIKIPYIFFKFERDDRDYAPEIYTSANFHFNPFSGVFPQMGEMLRFCDISVFG